MNLLLLLLLLYNCYIITSRGGMGCTTVVYLQLGYLGWGYSIFFHFYSDDSKRYELNV